MKRNDLSAACENARELLARRVDGELSAPEADLLQRHLAGCDACRDVASWIGDVDALSARAGVPEASPQELERIESSVMEEIGASASRPMPRRAARAPIWPRWIVPSAAAAAAVALLSWWQLGDGPDPLRQPDPVPAARQRQETADTAIREGGEEQKKDGMLDELVDADAGFKRQDSEALEKSPGRDEPATNEPVPSAPAEKLERGLASSSPPIALTEGDAAGGRAGLSLAEESAAPAEGALHEAEAALPSTAEGLFARDSERAPLDLRSTFREANLAPTRQNIARLLDAWSTETENERENSIRPQAVDSGELRSAKLRVGEFADARLQQMNFSFADSLRGFLETIADDEEHLEFRSQILRLLEELPDRRE